MLLLFVSFDLCNFMNKLQDRLSINRFDLRVLIAYCLLLIACVLVALEGTASPVTSLPVLSSASQPMPQAPVLPPAQSLLPLPSQAEDTAPSSQGVATPAAASFSFTSFPSPSSSLLKAELHELHYVPSLMVHKT
jgi:hypothetical protein